MDHRRTVASKAFVPSSWFIVLTVMLCIGGAGWIGWLVVDGGGSSSADETGRSTTPVSETARPSDEPSREPTPAPSATRSARATATPTPKPTPSPDESAVARVAGVSVLNNSGVQGAARAFSARVTSAGWTVRGVGNWTGSIGSNTVYYPPGLQDQAQLLAGDVGIGRVMPSVAPMRTDGLTIILSGPQ
ncbi:MAG: hypothetical protein JWP31_2000 [Aeromicrobium sp.]|nr:hypothetical protein [Aeromicrobium sp.]